MHHELSYTNPDLERRAKNRKDYLIKTLLSRHSNANVSVTRLENRFVKFCFNQSHDVRTLISSNVFSSDFDNNDLDLEREIFGNNFPNF